MSKAIASRFARVLVVVALAALPGLAQQTNLGGITGTVRDSSGAIIPGANVVAVDFQARRKSVAVASATKAASTRYPLLPIGTYSVTVTKDGFQKSVSTDVHVLSGETFTVDVTLAVGAVSQTVTVISEAALLDTTTVNQGTTRSSQEIAQLPIPLQGEAAQRRRRRGGIACRRELRYGERKPGLDGDFARSRSMA